MIFTPQQVQEILGVMDRYAITFIAHRIGPTVLTLEQKLLLRKHGFDVNAISANSSTVDQAFKFGLLTAALGDAATKSMSFEQFKKYLASGRMIPLNKLETRALENLRFQTYNDVNKLFGSVKNSVTDALVHADKVNNTVTHSKVVTDAVDQAIRDRKGVQEVISLIGHQTGKWETDLGRIADFVMHTAFDEGRAMGIVRNQGENALVYKDVYPGACNHCVSILLTAGIGSEPKLLPLSTVRANGTNVGRKVAEWKFVVGPTHPWCYDDKTEVLTSEGWKFFKDLSHRELFMSINPETGEGEWIKSINKVDQHYKGPMHHFTNKTFDLVTTPNHKHLIRTHKNKSLRLVSTDRLPTESQFLRYMPTWNGADEQIVFDEVNYDSADFCKWLGFYISEGCIIEYKGRKTIHIAQSQEKYLDEIYELTSKIFRHRSVYRCNGYVQVNLLTQDLQIKEYLQLGKANQKYIPYNIKNQTSKNIALFLDSFLKGDGSISKGRLWDGYQCKDSRVFYTSSKRLADDIGELILKIGNRPSFTATPIQSTYDKKRDKVYTQNQEVWCIRELNSKYSNLSSMTHNVFEYDGYIYDVELEKNHTLIVRRNGKVTVSGNCRCTLMEAPKDMTIADLNEGLWKWNGVEFERDMDKWKRKVQRTSKIKVTVNGKTTEI